MVVALTPFAKTLFSPLSNLSITANTTIDKDAFTIRYELRENAEAEVLCPSPVPSPMFVEGLWNHTCFECFLAPRGEDRYCEWNVAPNGNWAVFAHKSYREREELSDEQRKTFEPRVTIDDALATEQRLVVTVSLPLAVVKQWSDANGAFDLGLTAVVERKGEPTISYWALKHAGPKPDFHLRDSFILKLSH